MVRQLHDSATLMGVYREADTIPDYWLSLLFSGGQINFTDEYVDLEQIPRGNRKLAPFVAPMAQGQPIFESGSNLSRFKPGDIKPKDPINPTRVIARRPGELLQPTPDSPGQRYNAIQADITLQHRNAIQRRWEWMAAQAALYGQLTLEGDNYPRQFVDFQRAANHTVIKTGGSYWGEATVSPMDDIQAWSDRMQLARFGAPPTRITCGAAAWAKLRKDSEFIEMMDKQFKGSDGTDFNRGLRQSAQVVRMGSVGQLEVYLYSDFYEVGGVSTPFMDPRDILLSSPAVDGFRCFGAILDPNADYQSVDMFPRSYIENDPPIPFIMTQSAFLPVPLNPNATLRARVVA